MESDFAISVSPCLLLPDYVERNHHLHYPAENYGEVRVLLRSLHLPKCFEETQCAMYSSMGAPSTEAWGLPSQLVVRGPILIETLSIQTAKSKVCY